MHTPPSFQPQKQLILQYFQELEAASPATIQEVLQKYTQPDWLWRSYAPFYAISGAPKVAQDFWIPLLDALSSIERRQDIFFAGENILDEHKGVWVVSMGHLVGLFDRAFLGIEPTGKVAFFRYCEFNKIEDGKIKETAFYFDLPHFMQQTGRKIFALQRGAEIIQPGPKTQDGLLYNPCNPEEAIKTLELIGKMGKSLGTWQNALPIEEELAENWCQNMHWWGPSGIGSTYSIERYAKQHATPFRQAFSQRSKTQHICRIAEGKYGGFFGWPNFSAVHSGEFLGVAPTQKRTEFRVIDIYRREGDKLAENWVFIDFVYWFEQLGKDLLGLKATS